MRNVFKNKYRIVTDNYAGFEVQIKYWWWFGWHLTERNTFFTVERAKKYINLHKKGFDKYEIIENNL